jgi:hypothetical protein
MNMERTAESADLASIKAEDADTFITAAEHAQVKSGVYYFPRLYINGQISRMRWERHAGSILVYLISRRKVGGLHMNLYLPPFPFDPTALRHARQRMRDSTAIGRAGSTSYRRVKRCRSRGKALRSTSIRKSSSSTARPSWR